MKPSKIYSERDRFLWGCGHECRDPDCTGCKTIGLNPDCSPPKDLPRLCIIGHGRHGKDTVAEILRDQHGMAFISSSWFAAERVVMPAFKAVNQHYPSVEACFADRVNHRAFWYKHIKAFNTPDPTRLAREMMAQCNIYVGMRSAEELLACKEQGVFDAVIWVDASRRLPPEDASSCTITPEMADFILDNNGPEEELPRKVRAIVGYLESDGA